MQILDFLKSDNSFVVKIIEKNPKIFGIENTNIGEILLFKPALYLHIFRNKLKIIGLFFLSYFVYEFAYTDLTSFVRTLLFTIIFIHSSLIILNREFFPLKRYIIYTLAHALIAFLILYFNQILEFLWQIGKIALYIGGVYFIFKILSSVSLGNNSKNYGGVKKKKIKVNLKKPKISKREKEKERIRKEIASSKGTKPFYYRKTKWICIRCLEIGTVRCLRCGYPSSRKKQAGHCRKCKNIINRVICTSCNNTMYLK